MKESFWAKVLFREFTSHYITMTPKERAKDVEKSIIALTRLDANGDSFGSKMVGWANERRESKAATASVQNGALGGRPPTQKIPPPRNKDEVYDFAYTKNIPDWAVLTWWEQNYVERNGCDKDGVVIENWKGALINYFKAEVNKEKGK